MEKPDKWAQFARLFIYTRKTVFGQLCPVQKRAKMGLLRRVNAWGYAVCEDE